MEITIESGSKNGDNFIGIVYRATGAATSENGVEKLTIILKVAPTNKMRREKFFTRPAFEREIFVFNKVSCFYSLLISLFVSN